MANPSTRLLTLITTTLSILFFCVNAAPLSFADVEESWKRGLSEQDIHASSSTRHPTPSWIPLILSSPDKPDIPDRNVFEGMLDERTMAVRRHVTAVKVAGFAKMVRDVLRRGGMEDGDEVLEVEVEVLRPFRNRRWEFDG